MKNDKLSIRRKFILKRKKKYLTSKGFSFNQIFKLINKHFKNKANRKLNQNEQL